VKQGVYIRTMNRPSPFWTDAARDPYVSFLTVTRGLRPLHASRFKPELFSVVLETAVNGNSYQYRNGIPPPITNLVAGRLRDLLNPKNIFTAHGNFLVFAVRQLSQAALFQIA
jgi:hypothetical protein